MLSSFSLSVWFLSLLIIQTGNSKFMPRTVIETTAILSLDEEIKLNSDEVGFYKMVLIFFYGYNTILTPPPPTIATMGTEESGFCRQVYTRVNVWLAC